jgi:hypothetical protein
MQFHYVSYQRVERANEIKKEFKMVSCLGVLNIVLIPNGYIPLCGGQVVFEFTCTSLWVNKFKCH